jgi:hypothetical protein
MRISSRIVVRSAALVLGTFVLVADAMFWAGMHRSSAPVLAAELAPIQLPKPAMTGGMPLMQAFLDKPLPLQTLSDLLWAAFGVNRPRNAHPGLGRTAPSAWNAQEIQLDVVLADGVYLYDAEQNVLRPVVAGDLRGAISTAPAAHAAVTLVYVAPAKGDYAQVDCGFIAQNVYLFAASDGLNAWFYTVHAQDVAAKLGLGADHVVLYAQSVGYPPQ